MTGNWLIAAALFSAVLGLGTAHASPQAKPESVRVVVVKTIVEGQIPPVTLCDQLLLVPQRQLASGSCPDPGFFEIKYFFTISQFPHPIYGPRRALKLSNVFIVSGGGLVNESQSEVVVWDVTATMKTPLGLTVNLRPLLGGVPTQVNYAVYIFNAI